MGRGRELATRSRWNRIIHVASTLVARHENTKHIYAAKINKITKVNADRVQITIKMTLNGACQLWFDNFESQIQTNGTSCLRPYAAVGMVLGCFRCMAVYNELNTRAKHSFGVYVGAIYTALATHSSKYWRDVCWRSSAFEMNAIQICRYNFIFPLKPRIRMSNYRIENKIKNCKKIFTNFKF